MQISQPSLIARDDTFFGVCAGIGEDFGFNPNYLRVAFAVLMFFNPLAAVGVYAAAGAVVLFSRLLAPNPRAAAAPRSIVRAESQAQNDAVEQALVPIAA